MDLDLLRGAALVMLIAAFLALWAWAWSSKRKKEFEMMSKLPLEEDDGTIPGGDEARKETC